MLILKYRPPYYRVSNLHNRVKKPHTRETTQEQRGLAVKAVGLFAHEFGEHLIEAALRIL